MAQGATTRGTLEAVQCPHCGFKLNFKDAPMCDIGSVFSCDSCRKFVKIIRRQEVTVIYLQQTTKTVKGLQKT